MKKRIVISALAVIFVIGLSISSVGSRASASTAAPNGGAINSGCADRTLPAGQGDLSDVDVQVCYATDSRTDSTSLTVTPTNGITAQIRITLYTNEGPQAAGFDNWNYSAVSGPRSDTVYGPGELVHAEIQLSDNPSGDVYLHPSDFH